MFIPQPQEHWLRQHETCSYDHLLIIIMNSRTLSVLFITTLMCDTLSRVFIMKQIW